MKLLKQLLVGVLACTLLMCPLTAFAQGTAESNTENCLSALFSKDGETSLDGEVSSETAASSEAGSSSTAEEETAAEETIVITEDGSYTDSENFTYSGEIGFTTRTTTVTYSADGKTVSIHEDWTDTRTYDWVKNKYPFSYDITFTFSKPLQSITKKAGKAVLSVPAGTSVYVKTGSGTGGGGIFNVTTQDWKNVVSVIEAGYVYAAEWGGIGSYYVTFTAN